MDLMDILNSPKESDGQEPMDLSSPTSSSNPIIYSPLSSPSVYTSQFPSPKTISIDTEHLPTLDSLPIRSTGHHTGKIFDHTLPPLRSVLPDMISPSSSLGKSSSKYLALDAQCYGFRRDLPRVQPQCTPMLRNFHEHEKHALLSRSRSQSYSPLDTLHSRRHSSHSPAHYSYPTHRNSRRGTHPQTIWSIPTDRAPEDSSRYRRPSLFLSEPDTHYGLSNPRMRGHRKSRKKGPHNNKAYTREMIHWIRYHAVDRNMQFKSLIEPFFQQFPERRPHSRDASATHQILTSRLYRDNDRPDLDENGEWGFYSEGKDKGKLRMVKNKVRDRQTEEGKELEFPFTLVDKWPQRVLEYEWLSPITEEDRERARRILAGDDPSDPTGKKANWRRILNDCEEYIYKAES